MFSFFKKRKGMMKLATVVSKRSKTVISNYAGNRASIDRYFIKVMDKEGSLEEYAVTAQTYSRALKGSRIHLRFEDDFLSEIVLGV
jgi:hypothetical protein